MHDVISGYLFLYAENPLVVLQRRTVPLEDDPVTHIEEDIVDERERHEEEDDEHPSVVDDDVL